MRTKTVLLIALMITSGGLLAQSSDKKDSGKNKVKIHIEKEVDGKKTVIDTTFLSDNDDGLKSFMKDHEMKMEVVEGKGKDGKKINKEVIVQFNDDKGRKGRKMVLVSPDGSMPPIPPMPPMPPSPPSPPGIDEEMSSFNFNWTNEEGKQDGKNEKVIRIKKMHDNDEFHWNMADIDKIIDDSKSSKRSRREKKAKKRVIIIEEY